MFTLFLLIPLLLSAPPRFAICFRTTYLYAYLQVPYSQLNSNTPILAPQRPHLHHHKPGPPNPPTHLQAQTSG
ncbi:hypothetical protein M011DRAFT_469180, partial [Sporormia fimetaria CBS 119925]